MIKSGYSSIGLILFFILTTAVHAQQNFWMQTQGPEGAYIYCVAVSPANGDMYASTAEEGYLYRSTDGGESWGDVFYDIDHPFIHSIAINQQGYIFLGTYSGMFRSTDNGETWNAKNNGISSQYILSIVINNTNGIVFAGTNQNIYRSTNNGELWDSLSSSYAEQMKIDSLGVIYIVNGGVAASTDNGLTWLQSDSSLQSQVHSIVISPSGKIFSRTNDGLFVSTNKGVHWNQINTFPYEGDCPLTFGSNGELYSAYIGNVYVSTNEGVNWNLSGEGLNSSYIQVLYTHPNGIVFAGLFNDGGFYRTTNHGVSWSSSNIGLVCPYTYTVAIHPTGKLFSASGAGIFVSKDNGIHWNLLNIDSTRPSFAKIAIDSAGIIYAGGNKIYRSTDEGEHWLSSDSGLQSSVVYALAATTNGYVFAGTKNNGVFRSTNRGESWEKMVNGIPSEVFYTITVNTAGDVFAGNYGGIYRSTNGGDQWIKISNVGAYRLAPYINGEMALANASGIMRSIDNGTMWVTVNDGLTNRDVHALAYNAEGDLFAGSGYGDNGMFRLQHNNNSWETITSGLNVHYVYSFAVDNNGYVFAATNRGVYRSIQSTLGIGERVSGIATSFSLEQNYPNPFNPVTTITFSVSKQTFVTLKVYNILGQEVSTLVEKILNVGRYSINFGASQFQSGIYFYRLSTKEKTLANKMLLLK